MPQNSGKVYFIGGGPGDPELLTIKAKNILEIADIVIYADSLVHPSIIDYANPKAEIYGSKVLNLEEITALELKAANEGKIVARVQSGDPSIYGAILEQMRILKSNGVEFEIIPGVASVFAASALLQTELTVPGVSQSVVFTRLEGRVPMPPREQLKDLASHGCTLVIFLSITRMTKLVGELREAGYTDDTPIAVAYKVGWEEEQVIRGNLTDIAKKVREAKITLSALVMVGAAFDPNILDQEENSESSNLYSPKYTHLYRSAATNNK
ncbi:MAG TPA: precorrin-4 C(11)-methyltransferase [Dehalococcoidia bacterium]|jgi:precorrin-4/cobalt-precorrin-4 C11-methyltransferase|nr:precorrin-4 C(11)-methyltransferase [Dehalococcoidia bacterium]